MKKTLLLFSLSIILCFMMVTVFAEENQNSITQDENTTKAESFSSARGSYRSPGGSFSGGNRGGISPGTRDGYRTGPRSPSSDVTRNPRTQPAQPAPASRWGGFLGGLAAGTIIGNLFNPLGGFGYGGGGGFSLISILFWAIILYVGYKLFQKFRGRNR